MTVAILLKWCLDHKKTVLTGLGILIVLLWALSSYYCGESAREKRIDDRTGKIVEANIAANQVAVNANVVVKEAANKEAKANAIRKKKPEHVTANDAYKNLCSIYPEDCQ